MDGIVVGSTQPYPWPWNGALAGGRLGLVVVGCQRWWADRVQGVDATLAVLGATAASVRQAGGLVVHVRHRRPVGRRAGPASLPAAGDPGWEPLLVPKGDDVVVQACGMDAFFGGSLDAELRAAGRDLVAVGGLGTESAVYSSMTGANDRGYECLLLSDGAAPHDPAVAARALASVTMSGGIFGTVGTTLALRQALRSTADPPGTGGNGALRRAERRPHDLRLG